MAKKVTVPYNGKKYALEFTRATAAMIEKSGFSIDELTTKPNLMIPLLVHGAFVANHRNTKAATIDNIYDGLGKKADFVIALCECYNETTKTLTDSVEDGEEKNAGWEVEE